MMSKYIVTYSFILGTPAMCYVMSTDLWSQIHNKEIYDIHCVVH